MAIVSQLCISFPYVLHGLCEDYLTCDIAFNAVMPLSRASTCGRYSRIEGVTANQAIMSYQNTIANENLSLQSHIVWPCFIFVTQNALIMHNPDDKPSNCFILSIFKLFQLLRNI